MLRKNLLTSGKGNPMKKFVMILIVLLLTSNVYTQKENKMDVEKAKAILEQILDSNEKNAEAHYYLGFINSIQMILF